MPSDRSRPIFSSSMASHGSWTAAMAFWNARSRAGSVTQSADSHRTEWNMANANKPACQRGRVIALWRGRATAKKAGI